MVMAANLQKIIENKYMYKKYSQAALYPELLKLAAKAAEAILAVYHAEDFAQEAQTSAKSDHSPLTTADLASHHIIVEGLRALTPDYPVLSEESVAVPYAERRLWTHYWLVDPLDGTREFLQRNGQFTINIALIEEGEAVLGLLWAPALQTWYVGGRAIGAFMQKAGEAITPLRTRLPLPPYHVVASRSHPSPQVARLLQAMPSYQLLNQGSALKFALVAEGSADFYPRFVPTSEWDTAAGQAIVEAAGGAMLHLDGRPFVYNQKEELLNPYFVVVGRRELPWQEWLSYCDF
jgi:3'(2'), 5'-bisphosphate nucleotidase